MKKAVTKLKQRLSETYLQELQSSVISRELFKELDACNTVSIAIDSEKVIQVCNRFNGTNVVAFQVEVLKMLVVSQLVAEITNLGILSVLQSQSGESV